MKNARAAATKNTNIATGQYKAEYHKTAQYSLHRKRGFKILKPLFL